MRFLRISPSRPIRRECIGCCGDGDDDDDGRFAHHMVNDGMDARFSMENRHRRRSCFASLCSIVCGLNKIHAKCFSLVRKFSFYF